MRTFLALVLGSALLGVAACGGQRGATVQVQTERAGAVITVDGGPRPTPAHAGTASAGAPACRPEHAAGDFAESLESGGVTRDFRIHIPAGYDSSTPVPLVVNYHGYDRSAADQEAYSGLVPVADREGFILVSPDGAGEPQRWEVVDVYSDSTTADVQFTRALVERVRAEYCIDGARTYATGMSNGGEMASQAGCLLPDVFAAVAPVSGAVYQEGRCDGSPVPVISFQGTDDENVPFATVPPAMDGWAIHNGCSRDEPASTAVSAHVSRESYLGCHGNDVVLYVIDGGGHTWPGAPDDFPRGGAGLTTHEIDASGLIWAFFAAHHR